MIQMIFRFSKSFQENSATLEQGFQRPGKSWKTWKMKKKVMENHGKIMEFDSAKVLGTLLEGGVAPK